MKAGQWIQFCVTWMGLILTDRNIFDTISIKYIVMGRDLDSDGEVLINDMFYERQINNLRL